MDKKAVWDRKTSWQTGYVVERCNAEEVKLTTVGWDAFQYRRLSDGRHIDIQ